MEYVKKPVVVEAVQWIGDNFAEIHALSPNAGITESGDNLLIETREGTMMADLRDWVIRGVAGEVYPCKPDIFAATYEEVDQGAST